VWLENNPDDPIMDGEIIHHKNGVHEDNAPENLGKLENQNVHASLHHTGAKRSEETKRKLSDAKIGEKNPMFGRIGGLHHNYNVPMSEGQKKKISATLKGHIRSAIAKTKQSVSVSGENNHFYGKRHTEETKRKIGVASKNRTLSQEGRLKLSKAHKGKKLLVSSVQKRTATRQKNREQKQFNADVDQFFGGLEVA
tara:strand:- start:879 stop:1466 length:588 start_codon:yes stop_codon:yes gene_type:complete